MKRFSSLLAALVVAGAALTSFGESYTVDPVHSSIVFRIKHNNVSYFYGRFTAPEGSIVYDAAKPEASTFSFTVKTANLDTANQAHDTHIKSTQFFNAAEFPTITFKSTGVKKGDGDTLEVTGDMTIHGVKKSITVKLDKTGETNVGGKPLIGFETTLTLKRSDYGMSEMLDMLGDEVRLMVAFEGKK